MSRAVSSPSGSSARTMSIATSMTLANIVSRRLRSSGEGKGTVTSTCGLSFLSMHALLRAELALLQRRIRRQRSQTQTLGDVRILGKQPREISPCPRGRAVRIGRGIHSDQRPSLHLFGEQMLAEFRVCVQFAIPPTILPFCAGRARTQEPDLAAMMAFVCPAKPTTLM
jgi:hypothetical protein